jgi:hypothetical protein
MTVNEFEALAREYPDWQPWLRVVEEVMREATDASWETWVPTLQSQASDVPHLAAISVTADFAKLRRWQQHLLQTAAQSGAPRMRQLDSLQKFALDSAALFEAALCENGAALKQMADELEMDPDPFAAVTSLIAVPFLKAAVSNGAATCAAAVAARSGRPRHYFVAFAATAIIKNLVHSCRKSPALAAPSIPVAGVAAISRPSPNCKAALRPRSCWTISQALT